MEGESTAAEFACYENYPIYNLKPAKTVLKLTERQQKYAYHLSLAAMSGVPILFEQVWEGNTILLKFISRYVKPFCDNNQLYSRIFDPNSIVEKHFHQYIGEFFYQGGCFLGFGDVKFVPRCTYAELKTYLTSLSAYSEFNGIIELFESAESNMYSLLQKHIGFAPDGETWYCSPQIDKEKADAFNDYMTSHNILKENSCVRFENNVYYIVRASVQKLPDEELPDLFENTKVVIRYGAFSRELELCCKHLTNAILYSEGDNQEMMLRSLIEFYETGNMEKHLEYSRYWVQDSDPIVESYQGFIETYRDPTGVRAEYEAFVACVDPDSSRQLGQLLTPDNCNEILAALPIPAFLRRDTFNPPTYKAIDIVVFPTSGLPIGINIPNYDCIRQSFGFKNVSLQNVMAARETRLSEIEYVAEVIKPLIVEFDAQISKAEVATHELFGHGSGGLLFEKEYNDLSEAERSRFGIHSFYQPNETFYGKFGDLESAFEECRAEVSAFYLTFNKHICDIFDFPQGRIAEVQLAATYSVFEAGVGALVQFKNGLWLEAHSKARFCIIRYVMERTEATRILVTENDTNLEIVIDKARINEIVNAYGDMITELNIIKASADVQRGKLLFERLGEVTGKWETVRNVVYSRRKPRAVYIQALLHEHGIADWEGPGMNGLEVGIVSVENMICAGVL